MYKGITPDERYRNEMLAVQREILNELRQIRKLLGRDGQTVKQEPVKRKYTKRGA